MHRLSQARAGDIGISRLLDGAPRFEVLDLLCQEWPFESVGVVKVGLLAHIQGQVRLVVVIGILRNYRHRTIWQTLDYFSNYGGLTRTRTTGDTYDKHIFS